jgi:hypothetical protein
LASWQTGDAFQQCRLASAIGPDQPDDLARSDIEGHVGEHLLIAKSLADATHGH